MTLAPAFFPVFILGLLLSTMPAQAGDGHDHGETPATAAGPALPRFVVSSELFELVGVLQGRQLTLYLDHAATNAPVKDAKLELELGGVKLSPKAHGEGEFELLLAAAPKAGLTAVTATVSTPADSDLLTGELDIHEPAQAAHAQGWQERAPWWAAAFAGLIALGLLARRFVLRRRATLTGAAA